MSYIVVLTTAKNIMQAKKIAKGLVEKKLAACCNIVKGVRSIYAWKGKVCDDAEVLLIIKTRRKLFRGIENEIKRLHSYEVPEVVALTVSRGSQAYLDWLSCEVAKRS